jgi:hypothetical protein
MNQTYCKAVNMANKLSEVVELLLEAYQKESKLEPMEAGVEFASMTILELMDWIDSRGFDNSKKLFTVELLITLVTALQGLQETHLKEVV